MLSLVVALRPKGAGLALIARELALCAAQSPYTPVVGAHAPGVANSFCDALSRIAMPDKRYCVPPALAGCKCVQVPEREDSWWASLSPPPVPISGGKSRGTAGGADSV